MLTPVENDAPPPNHRGDRHEGCTLREPCRCVECRSYDESFERTSVASCCTLLGDTVRLLRPRTVEEIAAQDADEHRAEFCALDKVQKLRTENDVVWSNLVQGHYCKWCGRPAILVQENPEHYACLNDPECLEASSDA